jgi:sulfate adenylyltransferase subunit 2
MLQLARKAFHPATPPFPLLHVDTTWKFRDMYAHRDRMAKEAGMQLLVHTNREGLAAGVNPFTHGSSYYTDVMKTVALKQALDSGGYDLVFGGARRDEEKSRAKERIFSVRSPGHRWDPRAQRPELWNVYNTHLREGETLRVFPISNWTEHDVWEYIRAESIPIVPLYFARERPVVQRGTQWLMVDDERFQLQPGEEAADEARAFPHPGLLPALGGDRERRHDPGGRDRRDIQGAARPSARGGSSTATSRAPWREEAGGLFLMAARPCGSSPAAAWTTASPR